MIVDQVLQGKDEKYREKIKNKKKIEKNAYFVRFISLNVNILTSPISYHLFYKSNS